MTLLEKPLRPIRSFVLRQGRISDSQQQARALYWPKFGLSIYQPPMDLNWNQVFGRESKRVLEIGFGMGDSLIAMAQKSPEIDFIGIEVHQPGIGRCLTQANKLQLTNLKIFAEDAIGVLEGCIADNSLDKVCLFFPDPWPKTKHHKRRIVQNNFISLVAQKLKIGGQFHMATDWKDYADHMLAVLEKSSAFTNQFGPGQCAPNQYERPPTKFEMRGQKLGHEIWDLVYQRSLAHS